jgi:hypothetical protein
VWGIFFVFVVGFGVVVGDGSLVIWFCFGWGWGVVSSVDRVWILVFVEWGMLWVFGWETWGFLT